MRGWVGGTHSRERRCKLEKNTFRSNVAIAAAFEKSEGLILKKVQRTNKWTS